MRLQGNGVFRQRHALEAMSFQKGFKPAGSAALVKFDFENKIARERKPHSLFAVELVDMREGSAAQIFV